MKEHFLPCALLASVLLTFGSCKKNDQNNAVVPTPHIQSFTPSGGVAGSFVSISGTGFSPIASENTVIINGDTARILSADATSIIAVVPQAAGTGKITVSGSGGSSSSGNSFNYLASVQLVAGTGGEAFADGTGANAQLALPAGFAANAAGDFYFTDEFNNRIRKVTKAGVVTTIAGDGSKNYKDGPADQAEFYFPVGIAVDASGNIYVSDSQNNRIRKINTAGVVSTVAGTGAVGFAEGAATVAKFNTPAGLAIDGAGNLYVADAGNNRIRKITPAGVVSTISGTGAAAFKDGDATVAQFNSPSGIAIDASGNLYVGDAGNARIRTISPTGTVSTLAGSGVAGFADGTGVSAQFSEPQGICLDAAGNLYVADEGISPRVRKVTAAGEVTTLAGGGNGGDGPVNNVSFTELVSVTIDAGGVVYLGEEGAIRLIR
jgi:serine/threonine protein kinase, bacterial